MTFDGRHLWLVDFAQKRISKIDPADGRGLATFPTPDPVGGCKGVAWDGQHLWAAQRTNENWSDAKIFALEILQLQAP